jgi:hypothetical protein
MRKLLYSYIATFINIFEPLQMGKYSQIDDILIDGRRHSSVLDVRSTWLAERDADYYLVVERFRERLPVNK